MARSKNSTESIGRRTFLKRAGAGAVMVSAAGCAGQEPEDQVSPAGQSPTATEVPADTPTDEPEEGTNELVNIATQVIGTIDPAKHVDYTEIAAVLNYYDPFVNVDPDTFKPTGFIATEWNATNNAQTWEFTIREGVPFHRGGTITADDVVYSIQRMLAIGLGFSSLWAGFVESNAVSAPDDRTVTFELTRPYGPFLATLAQLFVVDSETVRENEESGEFGDRGDYGQKFLKSNVAGSGPYTLKSWQSGNEMVFEAFDDYWGGWEADQFEVARMKVVQEESTAKLMMKQGEADLTSQFMSVEAYEEMDSFDNVVVREVPQLQLFHLPLNTAVPPTDDVNVRKAIVHAFDYESAINDIFKGGARAAGPVPRQMPGHNENVQPFERDLDKAQQALEQSQYSVDEINEMGLEQVFVANFPLERKIALLLTSNLKDIGITNVENNPQQWATITDRATKEGETPHITHIFHTAKFPSPDSHTYLMFHPNSFGSYISMMWFSTGELRTLLEDARASPNLDDRLAKYKQAQEMIVKEYPSVFVANPLYRNAFNTNLGGWSYRGILSFEYRWYDVVRKGDGRAK